MKHPYLTALFGGACISLLPAWIVTLLVDLSPNLKPEELSDVSDFLSGPIGLVQILFFAIIIFVVPPLEELVFRGWLWKLFEWKLSPYWTWILISLIFAAVHLEPAHILGLLPFSFFAGWLRYKTGDIGPSTVAHITNNASACMLMVL